MKRTRWILSLFISSFFLVVFLPFQARSASVDTPNDKSCTGPNTCNVIIATTIDKTMRVIIKSNPGLPIVDSGNITLNPAPGNGETGEELAKRIVEAICSAAKDTGFTCSGFKNLATSCCVGSGCVGVQPSCCDATFSILGDDVDMNCSIGAGGFRLTRVGSDPIEKVKAKVFPKPAGGQLHALNTQTNGGNSVGADPLPQVLIRVRPLAVNGLFTFTAF